MDFVVSSYIGHVTQTFDENTFVHVSENRFNCNVQTFSMNPHIGNLDL